LKSESQTRVNSRIVITGIIPWRLCAEIPPGGDGLLGSLLLQLPAAWIFLAIPGREADIDKAGCRDLRVFIRMLGGKWSRKDHFPSPVCVGALGLHILVCLYLKCAEALGVHVNALAVFVLPIPNIDWTAFHLRHRLAMRKVGFFITHHELNRGSIIRVFSRIGILQENRHIGPIM